MPNPGIMTLTTPDQHNAAAEIASAAPTGGWIIEVGCWLGYGTIILGESKDPSVLLTCIDPFPSEDVPKETESGLYAAYSFDEWKKNTQDIPNLEYIRGFSPADLFDVPFTKNPDVVVIDLKQITESLIFWDKLMVSGGKFLVHTYYPSFGFTDLIDEITEFLKTRPYRLEDLDCSAILTKG